MKKSFLIAAILSLAIFLSGCQAPATGTETASPTGIANPASENCVQKGGTLEIRTNKSGEYGVCLFEDNRQCEEWALMRGDCPNPTDPNPSAGNTEAP